MSAPLAPCPSCRRHVSVAEVTCPFCAASLDGIAPADFDPSTAPRRVAHMALAVGVSLALGGCPSPASPAGVYGAAPPPVTGPATSPPQPAADAAPPSPANSSNDAAVGGLGSSPAPTPR